MKAGLAPLQRDALVVPEGGRGLDAPGEQVGDRVEADVDGVHRGGSRRAGDDRVEHRKVARVAGDAHRPAGELTRAADPWPGDHGRERALDDRQDADDRGVGGIR